MAVVHRVDLEEKGAFRFKRVVDFVPFLCAELSTYKNIGRDDVTIANEEQLQLFGPSCNEVEQSAINSGVVRQVIILFFLSNRPIRKMVTVERVVQVLMA